MQRVRIGLTGLAFVFVVVLIATIFFSSPREETPITPNTIEQAQNGSTQANGVLTTEPEDPLAELGVAPRNADTNEAQGANPSIVDQQ